MIQDNIANTIRPTGTANKNQSAILKFGYLFYFAIYAIAG